MQIVLVLAALLRAAPAAGRQPGASEHMLLQTTEARLMARAKQRPSVRLQLMQADSELASCLQRSRMEPLDLGKAVGSGLVAILEAVKHFTATPPKIGEGIAALGKNLLAVVDPLREKFNNTATFEDFEREWNKFFDDVPQLVDGVEQKIEKFTGDGRPDGLVLAIGDILTTLSDGVMKFVPHETALEIVRYVDAVGDILNAVGSSWIGFESGKEVQAIEDLYSGIRAAVEQMIPEAIRNDETYKTIVGALDAAVGDLSQTVLSYQKHMVEGAVCWKVQGARLRKRPHICPEGHLWNGEQLCIPKPSASPDPALISLEASTARKAPGASGLDAAAGQKKEVPDGALLAQCEPGSPFSELVGHWCYASCPAGMGPVGNLQCRTSCHGEFPADDGAMMCGHSREAVADAIMNMVVQVSSSAVETGLLIQNMADHGVDTDSLGQTISAFAEMGKPFAYKNCPVAAPRETQ